MTSNTPGVPSGGKVKLLWKGTALNSLCDKPAQAYFSSFDLLVTAGLNEWPFNIWLDWWNNFPPHIAAAVESNFSEILCIYAN